MVLGRNPSQGQARERPRTESPLSPHAENKAWGGHVRAQRAIPMEGLCAEDLEAGPAREIATPLGAAVDPGRDLERLHPLAVGPVGLLSARMRSPPGNPTRGGGRAPVGRASRVWRTWWGPAGRGPGLTAARSRETEGKSGPNRPASSPRQARLRNTATHEGVSTRTGRRED